MDDNLILVIFNIFIIVMLVLDLGFIQRKAHFPSMKEAFAWTAFWVGLALLFGLFVYTTRGSQKGLEFLAGYIVEKSLSVDNVFVFILIFTYFGVPREVQHKVLFWGILGAIIFRATFIVAGAALVAKFHWILYLLGAFLVFTAIKLVAQRDVEVHPEHNPLIRFARRYLPVTENYVGSKFFTRKNNKLHATPLFLVLLMIESTDITFATDSIPAIFAITQDTFIIYTSNICAVLGLRALYFVFAGFMRQFKYLRYGLSAVLGFIGVKMLTEPFVHIPIVFSLITIFSVISISVVVSILHKPAKDEINDAPSKNRAIK